MALTSLLYLLLGAVLGKKFCLFLILPSCLFNLLLHFGSFKVRSWSKGPPSACTCATQCKTRPAQIVSPFSAGIEGSFSSPGQHSPGLSLQKTLENHSSLQICLRKTEMTMKSCMCHGFAGLWLHPFPLALLSPPGRFTEHGNSWHCVACS